MIDCTVSGNRTGSGGSGGPGEYTGAGGSGGFGGGVFSAGMVGMTHCTLSGNETGAGGLGGNDDSMVAGSGGDGGGVYASGTLTMTDCTLSSNRTGNGAAGASAEDSGGNGGHGGDGAGVYGADMLTMTDCTISNNQSGDGGVGGSGDIDHGGSGGNGGRGGGVFSAHTLTMTGCTVSTNRAGVGNRGGTSDYRAGSGGSGGSGGGVYGSGTLSMTDCTVSGNQTGKGAAGGAGDDYGGNGGNGGNGGGVYSAQMLTMIGCTVAHNQTAMGASGGASYDGRNDGADGSDGSGGGLYLRGAGPNQLVLALIAENGIYAGPDIYRHSSSNIDATYSLIGNGADSGLAAAEPDAAGNWVGAPGAPIDPMLGPLAYNGGRTQTHALLAGSPAIDTGDPLFDPSAFDPPLLTDQRGLPRIVDGDDDGVARIDIGAYETGSPLPTVVGRHVFYNNSAFDDDDAAADESDDQAIAPDKTALLPGQTATSANYTNFIHGINGIMIDVVELSDGALPDVDDFGFKVGNTGDPADWVDAPAPDSITVRPGQGVDDSDRITLIWPDNAIRKQWLQVTMSIGGNLGLAEPDAFYFGNAPGEAGDSAINTIVNATDEIVARNFQHSAVDEALTDDPYDYNRDGLVDGTDQIIARANQTNPLTMLRLITAPATELKSSSPKISAADLDWLYELEQISSNRDTSKRSKSIKAMVDQLMASDWM